MTTQIYRQLFKYWSQLREDEKFPFKSYDKCGLCGILLKDCKYAYLGVTDHEIMTKTCDNPNCVSWLIRKLKFNMETKQLARFQDLEYWRTTEINI